MQSTLGTRCRRSRRVRFRGFGDFARRSHHQLDLRDFIGDCFARLFGGAGTFTGFFDQLLGRGTGSLGSRFLLLSQSKRRIGGFFGFALGFKYGESLLLFAQISFLPCNQFSLTTRLFITTCLLGFVNDRGFGCFCFLRNRRIVTLDESALLANFNLNGA